MMEGTPNPATWSSGSAGEFEGRSVLVTGAASGIGRFMAEAFAARGATVYAADLHSVSASPTSSIIPLVMRVEDDDAIAAAMSSIADRSGRLDVLFNAAGVHSPQVWGTLKRPRVDRVFAINTVGAMMVLQAAARLMVKSGGGRIVNVSSIAGRTGGAPAAYCASKAAVISMTQSAARAYAADGIRVNAIAPGPISTQMWSRIREGTDNLSLFDREMLALTPLARLGEPADLKAVTMLLASERSAHITGRTFNIDGGMTMK